MSDDLAVDVLIIGGGIQAHYLARQLSDDYSVCVLVDPSLREESLEAEGYMSAGYDGNDANRIQPARRAAGYWKLWAESNDLVHDETDPLFTVATDDLSTIPRLWSDASLVHVPVASPPPIFAGGSIAHLETFRVVNDVVINPSVLLSELRKGIEHCFVEGEVVKIGVANDKTVEFVDVELADGSGTVPIVPRYTVFAASGLNAWLVQKVALRFRDVTKRKEVVEQAKVSQAVRRRYVLCIKGKDLPLVSGRFGDFHVTSHTLRSSGERIWLVNPPVDDALTTLGYDDLRFDVKIDPSAVAKAVKQLFAMSPELERQAHHFEWGAFVRRRTEHPMMAAKDTSRVGQPAPAKIEAFGLEMFMALWPSHSSYAMIVGEVASERIAEALGPRADFGDTPVPSDFSAPASAAILARWESPDFPWHSWEAFHDAYGS